ncbi:AzlC family ABC transporter permease [Marinospirillum perlucidum]|uniref:AzlC family ABC transporter permease n=1 Tax=Marinospirillum perlucidum TaxID=1982602 RepID=UPI000DF308F6|nr:AzlC family ABC transporter permease [Marinospirillum perlucidum]
MISAEVCLDKRGTWLGFKRLLPLSMFVVAFGVAFGLAAVQTGLSKSEAVLMSAFVFAGASQFAALELWQEEIPLLPLILTTFAINARHLLMGASLYPWVRQVPVAKRYGLLTLISDANWAVALQDYRQGERNLGILFGGGLALWVCWVAGTFLGLILTQGIPDPKALGLDMVLGCFLLTMALGGKKDLRHLVIWSVAGATSLLALYLLPANTHVVAGALAGGLVGAFWLEDYNEPG